MLSKVSFQQNFKFCYDTLYAYIDCFIAVTTNSSKKSITELWFKRYVNMHSPALHLMLFSNCVLVYRKNPVFQTLQFMYPVGCQEKMTPYFVFIHFSSPFSSNFFKLWESPDVDSELNPEVYISYLLWWYFGRPHTFSFAFFKHRTHNLYESRPMLTASSILKYTSIIYFGHKSNSSI